MAQFHLLDPVYDESHRGRLVASGQVRFYTPISHTLNYKCICVCVSNNICILLKCRTFRSFVLEYMEGS
jgi:hypothetical protein